MRDLDGDVPNQIPGVRLRILVALAAIVAVALFAAGCGGGSDEDHPASDAQLVQEASTKIERAAAEVADPVRDRHIPGRKRMEVVCLTPDEARAKNVGAEFIQCHVEAFSTPSKQRPQSVYIESEDWRVPVESDGAVGEPVIVDGYRIKDFLQKDHRLGCSVGETPQERCKTGFAATPPPQQGVPVAPGGQPPTAPPQTVPAP